MKKLLMVAAVLASTTAIAQSNATVSGDIRLFQENSKTGTATSVNRMVSDQSHIGFKASEDLKNGLMARIDIDTFVTANAPAASSLGDFRSTIGLTHKLLGSVDLGRKKSVLNTTADAADPFGTDYGSTFTNVHNLQTTRLNNGVFVETAEFAGFKGAYQYGQSNTAGVAGTTGVGASYSAFGGEVHYAYQGERATGAKTNLMGISYTLPVLGTKLGFDTSNSYTATNAARARGNSFVVSGPIIANLEGRGTYGRTKTEGATDSTKALSLGVRYSLSKRTGVEVAYTNVNAPNVANDVRTVGAGLTHSF